MALQIIAWMASGLYFAVFPIETIRGEHLTTESDSPDPGDFDDLVPVWVAWNNVTVQLGAEVSVQDISLQARDGKTWFRISGSVGGEPFVRLVDGFSGQVAPQIGADEAVRIAQSRLVVAGTVDSVEWVMETEKGSEIRGRALPVWRVTFSEPESLSLYLDPWTGDIVARRTTRWRIFDFLWMLHIMDFDAREDFNTTLLQIAAALGLFIAVTGVIFWCMTTTLFRRRRKRSAAPQA